MPLPEVSVVIPLYGTHQGRRSVAAVSLAWLRQDVPCEIIVAVAGEIPAAVATNLDVHRRVTVVRADPSIRAAGVLRNLAAAKARGPVLYLTDADIVPLGRDYLTRALRLARGDVLAQPWMFRLLGGIDALESSAVVEPVDIKVSASTESCFVTATSDGTLRASGGEHIEWWSLGHDLLRTETPLVWPPRGTDESGMPEKYQRVAPFHWGGLLVPRWLFDGVGGYCRGYTGYGSEDDDLLVKIAATASGGLLVRGWQTDRSLTCLHLEHPRRRYVATTDPAANIALLTQRLAAGTSAMIQQDLGVL
jgi:hypothetical protein